MASRTTLNAKNLEVLGAERLAELLIEVSMGSAANKRRLRIELAGIRSSGEVAREVLKRLSSIERSRSKITWRRVKTLKKDLEAQRRVIVETIAARDANEAMEVAWRLMDLPSSIFARCDDTNGTLMAVFHAALADLGIICGMAKPNVKALAERTVEAILGNSHGEFDALIDVLAPTLGETGLECLRRLLVDRLQDVTVDGKSSTRCHERAVRLALKKIADHQGDVDAFIAQQQARDVATPIVAAEIAERLLAAGRIEEAFEALDKVTVTDGRASSQEWGRAWAATLDVLGRGDDAQAFRRSRFRSLLDMDQLRAFLKRLADFDDIEAEESALAHASIYPNVMKALDFLIEWPALNHAACLVTTRAAELDGGNVELLTRVAERLGDRYPLAAIIVLRAMIDFTLQKVRSTRYRQAVRQLAHCQSLAERVDDFGEFASPESYIAGLRARSLKRTGFWKMV